MDLIRRVGQYVKNEVWRPDDPHINVRKRRPGFGWTVNLHAVRERLAFRRQN